VGVALHEFHDLPAVDLEELDDVDAGEADGDEHLDDQLVPGRACEVRRCPEPGGELVGAGAGDPEDLLRAGPLRTDGLDEAVTLEPLEGQVDLADVQRPHLAGPGLELLPELQAVRRSLAQQSEQRMPDAHMRCPAALDILGSLLGISSSARGHRCVAPAARARVPWMRAGP
jgi:hypothetical protein